MVYTFNPTEDPRWAEFVQRHPRASVFHTPGWLEALRRTYGYEPIVYTTSPPSAELANGLVFCRVRSWLTGNRIVSLPFSDHCEVLVDNSADLGDLLSSLIHESETEKWKCVELRPLSADLTTQTGLTKAQTYYFHKLDLRLTLDKLFSRFHKT